MKPLDSKDGLVVKCAFCGAEDPDSEEVCPSTKGTGRHVLESVSSGSLENALDTPDKTTRRHIAHGYGSEDTISHCPRCGSGNIWGQSSGDIHCEWCDLSFTVTVQPSFPTAVQTINGVPMDMDGQPVPPGPSAPPGASLEEEEGPSPQAPPPGAQGAGMPIQSSLGHPIPSAPPINFGYRPPSLLFTADHNILDRNDFINYLALRHANNKTAILNSVKHFNQKPR
jgi:hypothetical protein